MSSTTTALQNAKVLEELADYYAGLGVTYCTAGTSEKRKIEDPKNNEIRPGSIAEARATAGPAVYDAAKRCEDLAHQLVEAHAELITATRDWRRVA